MATPNTAHATKLLPMLSYTDNSMISPYGISTVLAMVAEGASEECLNEILMALGYESLDELRESLTATLEVPCEAFKSKNSITLMRGEKGAELLEQFKQVLSRDYSATITEKDSDGEATVQLQNVSTFKAQWLQKMERDASHQHQFRNADGSESRPAFLNCEGTLRYYLEGYRWNRTAQAVALPYKLDNESIPFELVLLDSEKILTEQRMKNIISSMMLGKCNVEFPEFTINSEFDLIPMMKKLGLESMFDSAAVALDRIATVPLYAESFKQKAEIQVNRQGTIAKATTRMILSKCLASESRSEEFFFNRPFYYFLHNTDTGEILFMGRVNKLADCEQEHERNDLAEFFEAPKSKK